MPIITSILLLIDPCGWPQGSHRVWEGPRANTDDIAVNNYIGLGRLAATSKKKFRVKKSTCLQYEDIPNLHFGFNQRNATVGIPVTLILPVLVPRKNRFIGSCPADVENTSGSELRRVLEERNLHAVSTPTRVYQSTWWSGRAQHRGSRIDYVAVSSDWTDDAAKTDPVCDSTSW